jgi:uncharacterized protein (DUF1786 family)
MKILTIDVGKGTQDILLYDTTKNIENSIKLVLPSPTQLIARQIEKTSTDLFIKGEIMGGGPISQAISTHINNGYDVFMTETSARTIKDDLERVRQKGIEIIPNNAKPKIENFTTLETKDINLEILRNALKQYQIDLEFDYIGIAVQDHGYQEGMGDRNFRFQKIKEQLNNPKRPEELIYHNNIPEYFTRMQAVQKTLKKYNTYIMDSKFASVCGATMDPQVQKLKNYIIMDIGNGHTLSAAIKNEKIVGVYEHHTNALTPESIEEYNQKLANATLTHEEIHKDNGHGAHVMEALPEIEKTVVTGPNRTLMDKTNIDTYHAAPAGDVMMTGPAGLIKAISSKI